MSENMNIENKESGFGKAKRVWKKVPKVIRGIIWIVLVWNIFVNLITPVYFYIKPANVEINVISANYFKPTLIGDNIQNGEDYYVTYIVFTAENKINKIYEHANSVLESSSKQKYDSVWSNKISTGVSFNENYINANGYTDIIPHTKKLYYCKIDIPKFEIDNDNTFKLYLSGVHDNNPTIEFIQGVPSMLTDEEITSLLK